MRVWDCATIEAALEKALTMAAPDDKQQPEIVSPETKGPRLKSGVIS